jgi:hypothetical protein
MANSDLIQGGGGKLTSDDPTSKTLCTKT